MRDAASGVLLTQTYDPYGSVYAAAGPGATHFGFSGEQVDASGLIYLRARYYSPGMGRFFQRDPWGGDPNRPQTFNPYMYGLGNPLLYTDPSGKQAAEAVLTGGIIIAVIVVYVMWVAYNQWLQSPSGHEATMALSNAMTDAVNALSDLIGGCVAPPAPYPMPTALPDTYPYPDVYNPEDLASVTEGEIVWQATPGPSSTPEPHPYPTIAPIPPVSPPTVTSTPDNRDIVYRNPRAEEHPRALAIGFFPPYPDSQETVWRHVRYGSETWFRSPYISMTRSFAVARRWQQPHIPIYEINLNEVVGVVYDLTIPTVFEAMLPANNSVVRNWARASREVVLDGYIPPNAIEGTIP